MVSGVMMPQKRPGMMQQALPIAGQVIGGAAGGPAGAAVGGMVGGKLGEQKQGPAAVESTAMQRRAASMQPQADPVADLQAADQALAQMPPPVQEQYRPAIQSAMQRAAAQRGGGGMA